MSFRNPFFDGESTRVKVASKLLNGANTAGSFTSAELRDIGTTKLSESLGSELRHDMTLLHVAAGKRHSHGVAALLRAGADYSKTDCFGNTPYDLAVKNNDFPTLRVFNEHVVDREIRTTKDRVAGLDRDVRSLKRRRDALEGDNVSLRKKNRMLVEDNTTLRRSTRIAQQREDRALRDKDEAQKDRDVFKKRYETMRDKVFRK